MHNNSVLDFESYRDKLNGCWTGKNVGGTLGAPFECLRGAFDITGYTSELNGEPLPNDDLDLQLIWLEVCERYRTEVDAAKLGEYWHWFVTPHWGEYGAGKNNMRAGLLPPLSGTYNNAYRDSCGAFILSEIWACLCPGNPEAAVRYAYEDAVVNHAGEGLYGEVFCAAVESAAFAESDTDRLIDIGLSYIPQDCGVAKGVRVVREAFAAGLDWKAARKKLLIHVPCSFGAMGTPRDQMDPEIPIAEKGYDAPANVAIVVLGWLYGRGDFGRSICIAAGCGEDADCTAGTLGAILGIVGGYHSIGEEWTAPLGGKIKTRCINTADVGIHIPKTVDELTERVLRLTPFFMGDRCDVLASGTGYTLRMDTGDNLFMRPQGRNCWYADSFLDTLACSPYTTMHRSILFDTQVNYGGDPEIRAQTPRTLCITLTNNFYMQQWVKLHWHLPDGWTVSPCRELSGSLESYYCNLGKAEFRFTLEAPELLQDRYDLVLDISSVGHHTRSLIPITLFSR